MKLQIFYHIDVNSKNNIRSSLDEGLIQKLFIDVLDSVFDDDVCRYDRGDLEDKTISLNFVSDEEIKKLNLSWRNIAKSTDCLSFPYEPEDWIDIFWDIFIAMPYVQNQANKHGVSLSYEISKLFVHSALHIFGYDHEKESDFLLMQNIEDSISNYYSE